MQITSETVEPCQVRLTIVVPESRVDRAMHDVAQEFGKRLKVPGYRPGKIPVRAVLARLNDEGSLREEALDRLARQVVVEAITSEKLEPSAPASVDIEEQHPLTLKALVPLQPFVNLGEYQSALRLEPPAAETVGDSDVDEVIERLRADLAYLEPLDRGGEEGDVLTLHLTGKRDDGAVIFEDESLTLRLSDTGAAAAHLPDSILDHLLGKSAGEVLAFTLQYPDDWQQPELQQAEIHFSGEVEQVASIAMPEADDDFAMQVSDAESLDELRSTVRRNLETRAELTAREQFAYQLLDALVAHAQIAYPPAVLDADTADLFAQLQSRVERQGLRWERWLELQKQDEDSVWADLQNQARHRLERRLALAQFVRSQNISLPASHVDAVVSGMRKNARPGEPLPSDKELRNEAVSRLLAERALGRLVAIAEGRDESSAEMAFREDESTVIEGASAPPQVADTLDQAGPEPKLDPDAEPDAREPDPAEMKG